MTSDETTGVLERLLDPISRSLNPQSASALAGMKADAEAQARVEELAGKCNQGLLSPGEQKEYETYVHAGSLISILQAKARLYLKQHKLS